MSGVKLEIVSDPFPRESRADAWYNPVTGFGTSKDKTMFGRPAHVQKLDMATLSDLYNGDDIAARMVEIVPEECMRKPPCIELDEKPLEDVLTDEQCEQLETLDLPGRIIEADVWGRLYGGAAIVLGVEDGGAAFDQPLSRDGVHAIKFLSVRDRQFLSPATFYTSGPLLREPEIYNYSEPGTIANESSALRIHESRMVVFRGARTPLLQRQGLNYWDYSVLQKPIDIVRSFAAAYKSVEILLSDGPQASYGIKDLAGLLGAGGTQKLQARLAAIDFMRSAAHAVIYDKDNESFERSNVSFGGIDSILDKFMLRLAAAVRMPVTILMGQSPAGMNATGESDFRWFYDQIATRRCNYLEPRVRKLYSVVLRAMGVEFTKLEIEWPNLWEPTETERVQIEKTKADTAKVYLDAQVLTPEEYACSPDFDAERYGVDVASRKAMIQAALDAHQEQLANPPDPNAAAIPPGQDSAESGDTSGETDGAETET